MSSPLDRIEARLESATRHGHGGNGSWVYGTSDVLALVNVAKAAEKHHNEWAAVNPPDLLPLPIQEIGEALATLHKEPA